jgi:hypothetical protein
MTTVEQNPEDIIPKIPLDGLDEEQRKFAGNLHLALIQMNSFVNDFTDDLKLFDHCERNFRFGDPLTFTKWQLVAARDGSMNIFHFRKAIIGAGSSLAKCPPLFERADKGKMKECNKFFRTHFPDYERIRDSVGHAADNSVHPDKNAKHKIKGGARHGDFWVGEVAQSITGLKDRKFITTYEGTIVSYEVSDATLGKLLASKRLFYAAFRSL